MKIIKIELNNVVDLSVKLVFKKHWWAKKLSIMLAFTNYSGPTYHSDSVKFLYYYDELGNKLDDEISGQIFSWLGIHHSEIMGAIIPYLKVR